MISIFKKPVTVEQIHAEFDSAEERIIKQVEKILSELSIPKETDIERKANLAEKIGFINSEIVEKAKPFRDRNEQIKNLLDISNLQAQALATLKIHYPCEKFITVIEFERICKKYKLIHAPIANYIKDVPEKNLMEIKKAKPLMHFHEFRGPIDKSGLYIAAPESHFYLKGLIKFGNFGWITKASIKKEDPIVYEYCMFDFIRIISKWGTPDDQAFLDPSLVNEILN